MMRKIVVYANGAREALMNGVKVPKGATIVSKIEQAAYYEWMYTIFMKHDVNDIPTVPVFRN